MEEFPVPDDIHARFALPADPDLDAFTSGVPEVDTYFRSRRWFNDEKGRAAPPTYEFLTPAGDVVGYAAVSSATGTIPMTEQSTGPAISTEIAVMKAHTAGVPGHRQQPLIPDYQGWLENPARALWDPEGAGRRGSASGEAIRDR